MGGLRIQDIAKKAKVSASTVSRVLNNKGTVTDATRKRVMAAVREAGFEPRKYEKKQAELQGRAIGIVSDGRFAQDLSFDPFYGEIMQGVESYLSQFGYSLLFKTLQAGDNLSAFVRSHAICGLLFVGYEIDKEVVTTIRDLGVPLVLLDNDLWDEDIDCVVNDNVSGARKAVTHLIAHKHRDIAIICGPLRYASFRQRYLGYRQALESAGLASNDDLCVVFEDWGGIEDGYRGVVELFAQRELRPTAIFGVNDPIAISAMRALRDIGYSVPDDVSVVGFDDIAMSAVINPALSTVKVFKREMGVLGAKRLCELIDHTFSRPIKLTVTVELVVRESTAGIDEPRTARGRKRVRSGSD